MKIMVTGGAGFIGSNFLNLFVPVNPQYQFINLDKLTYAANLLNLEEVATLPNYTFVRADLADYASVQTIFSAHQPDLVFHFAAESHVDRSIHGPSEFIHANIIGTFNLLEASRSNWLNKEKSQDPNNNRSSLRKERCGGGESSFISHSLDGGGVGWGCDLPQKLFLHVSTDEVYGSLGPTGLFTEQTAYDPSSPYSASKASSDHLVRAYHRTYGLPAIITNCSNNYGPYQFPEKLIPLMIINALEGKPLPIYGRGDNVRDWLYVEDHCHALCAAAFKGTFGDTYNIGGNNEWKNIDIVNAICETLAIETGKTTETYKKLITFVQDRPGHDLRYAIDSSKIQNELGWKPNETFETGLRKTIKWYLSNPEWVETVRTGSYRTWLEQNYSNR